ncbi:MAG TPA: hypothetical protein VIG33_18350 [Pseudobdellovibrionaceae bacterium]|jgi:hypothetical protein
MSESLIKKIEDELKKRLPVRVAEDGYAPGEPQAFSEVERRVNSNIKDLPFEKASEWEEAKNRCEEISIEIRKSAETIFSDPRRSGTPVEKIKPHYYDARVDELVENLKDKLEITTPNQDAAVYQD